MPDRAALEAKRSPAEMGAFLDRFTEQRLRDHTYARRTGVIKDVYEEYLPLYLLVRNRPDVAFAWLEPKSNVGPDAMIETTDRRRQSVQITSADSNEQAYFNRLAGVQRRPYFPAQQKRFNRNTGQIQPIGRALEAPAGIVQKRAVAVRTAIERKIRDSSGTDILLIAMEAPVRPKRLLPAVKKRTTRILSNFRCSIPFRQVYVLHGDCCQRMKLR